MTTNSRGFVIAKVILTDEQLVEIYKVGMQYKWNIRESQHLLKGNRESGDFNFFDYLKYKMRVDINEFVCYKG